MPTVSHGGKGEAMVGSGGDGRAWQCRGALLVAVVLLFAGCNWMQFGFSAAHTRYNPTETVIGVGNVASLTTAWTGSTGGLIESSAAIARGTAYVGSDDGSLYAFDADGSTGCSGSPKTCVPL